MLISQNTNEYSQNNFVIHTHQHNWVIPHNCELLKAIIEQQKLTAKDLIFLSDHECKHFIKQVFLMALEDETKNNAPSKLAKLGRELVTIHQ